MGQNGNNQNLNDCEERKEEENANNNNPSTNNNRNNSSIKQSKTQQLSTTTTSTTTTTTTTNTNTNNNKNRNPRQIQFVDPYGNTIFTPSGIGSNVGMMMISENKNDGGDNSGTMQIISEEEDGEEEEISFYKSTTNDDQDKDKDKRDDNNNTKKNLKKPSPISTSSSMTTTTPLSPTTYNHNNNFFDTSHTRSSTNHTKNHHNYFHRRTISDTSGNNNNNNTDGNVPLVTTTVGHCGKVIEYEECELFDDTFTFLMVSRYPFEQYCCNARERRSTTVKSRMTRGRSMDDDDDDDDSDSESDKGEYKDKDDADKKHDNPKNPQGNNNNNNNNNKQGAKDSGDNNNNNIELDENNNDIKRRSSSASSSSGSSSSSSAAIRSRLQKADSDYLCFPFWVGVFVNTSQIFIYTIVIANLFVRGEMPPNADRWLRLAQIFAVLVTLYTQSDFIDGIFLITERWKAFEEITGPVKFNISAFLRILIGNFGIVATFLLVMYSTEVVDLLLNFTAMEFVATLDNSAFEIASKGFLGITLEKKAMEIQDFRYVRRTRRGSFKRVFAYVFYVVLVFSAFLVVVALQSRRLVGVDNEVYVQFDDTDVSELFGVSGVYKGCKDFRTRDTGDIGYVDISYDTCPIPKEITDENEDGKNNGKTKKKKQRVMFPARSFLYCWDLNGWVFIDHETDKPCDPEQFLLRSFLDDDSVLSDSFDILIHSKANWVIRRGETSGGGEAILDFVFIDSVKEFQSTFIDCEAGLETIHLEATKPFPPLPLRGATSDDKSTFYPIFTQQTKEGIMEYSYTDIFGLMYRPIFAKPIRTQNAGKYQVILFDGLRWIWLALNPKEFVEYYGVQDECFDYEIDKDDPDCWAVFVKYFHRDTSWYFSNSIIFLRAISDPMKILTPSDTGLPTDKLTWYQPERVGGKILRPGKVLDANDETVTGEGAFGLQCFRAAAVECTDEETLFQIELTTDKYAYETRLMMFYGNNYQDIGTLASASSITSERSQAFTVRDNILTDFVFETSELKFLLDTCIPKTKSCLQVLLLDEYGDGLLHPGGYKFTFGDQPSVEDDNDSTHSELFSCNSFQFGPNCGRSNETLGDKKCTYDGILENYPIDIQGDGSFFDDDYAATIVPTGEGSYRDITCGANEGVLDGFWYTDEFPEDSQILLYFGQDIADLAGQTRLVGPTVVSDNDIITISEGIVAELTFSKPSSYHFFQTCVPTNQCIQAIFADLYGDGVGDTSSYSLSYSDNTTQHHIFSEAGNDSGWACRSYQLGPNCTSIPPVRLDPTTCSYQDDIQSLLDGTVKPTTFVPSGISTAINTFFGTPSGGPVECTNRGDLLLSVNFTTDQYPEETQVLAFYGQTIQDIAFLTSSNRIISTPPHTYFSLSENVLTDLRFEYRRTPHTLNSCVPLQQSGGCIQVVVIDSNENGLAVPGKYSISDGTTTIDSSGSNGGGGSSSSSTAAATTTNTPWNCRLYQFGPGCIDFSRPMPTECSYLLDVVEIYPGDVLRGID